MIAQIACYEFPVKASDRRKDRMMQIQYLEDNAWKYSRNGETSIRRFKEPNWSPSKKISLYINSKPAQHQRQMVLNETRAWWRRRGEDSFNKATGWHFVSQQLQWNQSQWKDTFSALKTSDCSIQVLYAEKTSLLKRGKTMEFPYKQKFR